MQSDLEEAKTQENTKLQSALEDIQFQFQETKTLLIKEREAVKIAAEQAPIVQEVPVIDHEIVNKLTAENEQLKVRLLKLWCMSFLELPWIVWICL
jgi:myosin-5